MTSWQWALTGLAAWAVLVILAVLWIHKALGE